MCFSGRMSHLGLDTLWCLKHTLKLDTPSTYLLAAHNNLNAGYQWEREGGLQENLQGLMWCGASASTQIHETVRHTWRFDFYSSNSFSVVLSSTVWNMSSWKKSMFVRFSFCSFFFSFGASLPYLSLFWVFVLLLLPLFFLFFFFRCSLFHLTSDLARFGVQFRSCMTVQFPLPHRHTRIHTFPQTDTPPSHSKQINSSHAAIGCHSS